MNGLKKVCPKCATEKPVEAFSFRNKSKGILANQCKDCHRAYAAEHYARNTDAYKRKSKDWRSNNPDQYLASNKKYYAANKEKNIIYSKRWAKENPEKRMESWQKYRREKLDRVHGFEAAYRERNRDVCNGRIKKWKALNKHLLAEYSRRRKAVIQMAFPQWADVSKMQEFYLQAKLLRDSTSESWHVDHIVPLKSKTVCGLHVEHNLAVVPGKENLKKNNRWWPDMPI